jgi:hypothetical protein
VTHVAFPTGGIADAQAREQQMETLDDQVHKRLEQLDDAYNSLVPRDGVLEAALSTRPSRDGGAERPAPRRPTRQTLASSRRRAPTPYGWR